MELESLDWRGTESKREKGQRRRAKEKRHLTRIGRCCSVALGEERGRKVAFKGKDDSLGVRVNVGREGAQLEDWIHARAVNIGPRIDFMR